MKKPILSLGVYLCLGALLSACAQSFQEKKIQRTGTASAKDVEITKNADQSITLNFNGIRLQVSNTKVEDGRSQPVCQARVAAIGDGVSGSIISARYHRVSGNALLQIDQLGVQSSLNMDTCVGYREAVENTGATSKEHFDGVSQTQGKDFYTSFFTRCANADCSEAYGLLKIAVNNYQSSQDEYRECGFQIMNFESTVDAICLEKGQSFSSSGGTIGVQCAFNEGDDICSQK